MIRILFTGALTAALAGGSARAADDGGWHVVLDTSEATMMPQLPPRSDIQNTDYAHIADAGIGSLSFQLNRFQGADGIWRALGPLLVPVAQEGVADTTGPGRSGAESGDVFRHLYFRTDSSGDGALIFSGSANNPAAPSDDASYGLWLRDGARNVEFARLDRDDSLGPQLGPGWIYSAFHNSANINDATVRGLPHRRALFAGRIQDPEGHSRGDGLSIYAPGVGNTPCMLNGDSGDLGPGVAGTTFSDISDQMIVSPRGDVFNAATIRNADPNYFDGIWKFCDGAPKPRVLVGATGDLGPGLAEPTAFFGGDSNGLFGYLAPTDSGGFYFSSGGIASSAQGAPKFFGLFYNNGQSNWPILFENRSDDFGPHLPGYVFHSAVVPYRVKAAGKYAVLNAVVSPTADPDSSFGGLWRITPEGRAQPVALGGADSPYPPQAGRAWTDFYQFAIFDNGDIVVVARVSNPTEDALWRLRPGAAPEEILKVGDPIAVPTPAGVIIDAIDDIGIDSGIGLPPLAGDDAWATRNGEVILRVGLRDTNGNGTIARGLASRPNYLFEGDFD